MVQLILQDDQIVDLVRQLPSSSQRRIAQDLAAQAALAGPPRMAALEARLRTLATQRGLQ